MGWISDDQIAANKAVRALAWTKPFTIQHYFVTEPEDAYDDPEQLPPSEFVFSGDYTWRSEDLRRGVEGGVVDQANILMAMDIDLEPYFTGLPVQSGVRLIVEGKTLALMSLNTFPDHGELVVTGKLVK